MPSSRMICCLSVGILCLIGSSTALSCYECSSLNKQTCSVPAKELLKDCGAGTTVCYKFYSKVSNVESTARGCGKYSGPGGSGIAEDQCQENMVQGVMSTVCNCKTDSCNRVGRAMKFSAWTILACVVISTFFLLSQLMGVDSLL